LGLEFLKNAVFNNALLLVPKYAFGLLVEAKCGMLLDGVVLSPVACTTPPVKDRILAISVEMIQVWDLRVQSSLHLGESKHGYSLCGNKFYEVRTN
jgi:hypothetical protein